VSGDSLFAEDGRIGVFDIVESNEGIVELAIIEASPLEEGAHVVKDVGSSRWR